MFFLNILMYKSGTIELMELRGQETPAPTFLSTREIQETKVGAGVWTLGQECRAGVWSLGQEGRGWCLVSWISLVDRKVGAGVWSLGREGRADVSSLGQETPAPTILSRHPDTSPYLPVQAPRHQPLPSCPSEGPSRGWCLGAWTGR